MTGADEPVRRAALSDAEAIGRLLHDFNSEFGDFTPGPDFLAQRVRALMATGDVTVLITAPVPRGLALLRFRPSLWSDSLDCYVEELYVVPDQRGQGLGRALMEAAIGLARERGAKHMDLGTGDDDVVARALYESLGFDNHEGKPDGSINYFYAREL